MKKLILLASSALIVAGCSTSQDQSNLLSSTSEVNTLIQSVAPQITSKNNPDFDRKLKEKKNYKVRVAPIQSNSICGKDDLQQVNSYDGSLGQPIEFVDAHKPAVGALEEKGSDNSSKFCSGTLIGKNLFLTASHCVDSSITKKFVAFNYEKGKGSEGLLPQEHFKITKIVEEGSTSSVDYSIIALEGNPGDKYGFAKIHSVTPEKGHLLTIIQHPSGEPKQVESGFLGTSSGVYVGYSDLDTEPGSSGSGVMDKDGFLVAVHTNGGCTSAGGENKGVRLSEIAKVSAVIRELDQSPKPRR